MTRFLLSFLLLAAPAAGDQIYNSLPSPIPPGVISLSFAANGFDQAGDLIQFAGSSNSLISATVLMSNYSFESGYEPLATSTGFRDSFYLTLYSANSDGSVGPVLASATQNVLVPWQPEPGGGCTTTGAYRATDGFCYLGQTFTVTFDFADLSVPNQIIYGVSYNTGSQGPQPFGTPGPYDGLNFGYTSDTPSVGSNPTPTVSYFDKGAGFQAYAESGLDGYSGTIAFETAPEPSTWLLLGSAGLVIALRKRISAHA